MTEILPVAATSAVVATLVGFFLNLLRESVIAHRSSRLDALRVAVLLEGYAIQCADAISDHDLAVDSGGHAGLLMGAVPKPPGIELNVGLLQPRRGAIANRLAVFTQEALQADQSAAFWWEVVGDHEAARNAARHECACLGLRGLSLAADLRSVFKLPKRKLIFGTYDISVMLQNTAGHEPK